MHGRNEMANVEIGHTINYASREISMALDAFISARVNPELTGMRGMVLGYLMQSAQNGREIYQRDLEAKFHTGRSSITTMLQGLEQSGFITREAVQQDARLKRLVPTEKGRQCAEGIRQCITEFERDLQSGITAAETQMICSVLHKLIQNAKEIRNTPR